jgi:hypothetical protein
MFLETLGPDDRCSNPLAGGLPQGLPPSMACRSGATKVELAFDSKALRALCETELKADEMLGADAAKLLRNRLADLKAASSVKELLAGNPRLIEENGDEAMLVELCGGYQLIFVANHVNCPVNADDVVDWHRVRRIKILRIHNETHGC